MITMSDEDNDIEEIMEKILELEKPLEPEPEKKSIKPMSDIEKREPMDDIESELLIQLKEALFKCYLIKRFGTDEYVIMSERKDAEYHNSVLPSLWLDFEETLDSLRELPKEQYETEFAETFGRGRTRLDETTNKLLTDAYRRLADYRRVLTERKRNEQAKTNLERVKEHNLKVEETLAKEREEQERKEAEKLQKEETKGLVRQVEILDVKLNRAKTEKQVIEQHNRREIRKLIKKYNKLIRKEFDNFV